MRNVLVKTTTKQVKQFNDDDGIAYHFKHEVTEIMADKDKSFEISDISILVIDEDQKKLFFMFRPLLKSELSYGTLSIVSKQETQEYDVIKDGLESITTRNVINFSNMSESGKFSNILANVHIECVKIVSKYKDKNNVVRGRPEDFFEI